MALNFRWAKFRTVRVYRADGPQVPGGQSACSSRTVRYSGSSLEVLFAFSDGPRRKAGQSMARVQTVRGTLLDGPRGRLDSPSYLAGRSARGFQLCFLVRFLPPFLVLLRVLQGIVPKTRG
jgi:hypothetical protein